MPRQTEETMCYFKMMKETIGKQKSYWLLWGCTLAIIITVFIAIIRPAELCSGKYPLYAAKCFQAPWFLMLYALK